MGAGAWGTALAIVLAPRFSRIRLWVYEGDLAVRMKHSRENDLYLLGWPLPASVGPVSDMAVALDGADVVMSVVPSHLVRESYQRMLPFLSASMALGTSPPPCN